MVYNKFNSSVVRKKDPFHLPRKFKFLKVMGEGGFGTVVKCREKDTKQIVAIKILKYHDETKEIAILNKLMSLDFDKRNIVEFLGWFPMTCGRALVFEMLDISLDDYLIKTRYAPMISSDIRTIIRQVATAFDALKSIGVIHTDVKPDNIMLAKERRPFRVKLIDFGLAIPKAEASQEMSLQTTCFKSPEVMLGLPITEAIDMWSLGCVMFLMISGFLFLREENEYETLQCISEVLGQPADHLLNDGQKTALYFKRTKFDSWRLKTPLEFWGKYPTTYCISHSFRSLDELKKRLVTRKIRCKSDELDQCFDLLKGMLKVDTNERITPNEVLTHSFVVSGLYGSRNECAPATAKCWLKYKTWFKNKTTPEKTDQNLNESLSPTTTQPPSRLITVCPAAPGNILQMDSDLESDTSVQTYVIRTSGHLSLGSKSEDSDCEPPATTAVDDDTTDIQLSPFSALPPSCVIMVRPATAENTLELEDEESLDSSQAELSSVTVARRVTMDWTSEDSSTLDDIGIETKTTSKKKGAFRRIFSWMKKTFGSCLISVVDE